MDKIKNKEVWFVTGSQHLYGPETLNQVADDSKKIAGALNASKKIVAGIVFRPVLTTPESVYELCLQANADKNCIGLITWMHTFSPAKMWIKGLSSLSKPFLHFHTQLNRDIPWGTIDMDFMNLNQSAHGDREFGFIGTRLRLNRKIVVGHYEDPEPVDRIAVWIRAAKAFDDARNMKVARFGDNMRDVAVTEGDKVSAQIKMGYSVYGYGVGDLVKAVNDVSASSVKKLVSEYAGLYKMTREVAASDALKEAARIEAGMEAFLKAGNFKAFTTTFEDLHGLKQLPGIAVQRLMAAGYGFGAEGDWKTAALVRSMKVMAEGLKGGTSFMEDYTYHFDPKGMRVLGAHMLEVCPSVATGKPKVEIHQLSIGGKADPARLVFTTSPGKGINVSVIDLGNRFRMIVNDIEVVKCPEMPKLPVARVLWKPLPDLKTGAAAWIMAGGAHHTGFSTAIDSEYLEDFADMLDIEYVHIDEKCDLYSLKKELRWNEVSCYISGGIK
ncbi:MAG TPA: L-arabinose isomerase [Bacteroidales bacterium]|nr:L-arabinose isomerase [Bacteroidales bacterium]HPF03283.1 L-arabinose isomerase [Bacteroidales bacterium]HPJ58879.1 L-arabinose isomerase [Bacteroidales bacterium]HPR12133.1 L-arabinose isomerase [Bacteroidales bacterium]HRW84817.1 L-arabinose isomerase [Bacteroidales bacterium]